MTKEINSGKDSGVIPAHYLHGWYMYSDHEITDALELVVWLRLVTEHQESDIWDLWQDEGGES